MTLDDLAGQLRGDLAGVVVSEKKMFGGICFLLNGNMVSGTMKAAALFRVGKDQDRAALALAGTRPMQQGGKAMAGFVELPRAECGDERRATLSAMALAFVQGLPAK